MVKYESFYLKKFLTGISLLFALLLILFISSNSLSLSSSSHKSSISISFTPEPSIDSDYPVYRVRDFASVPEYITATLELESRGTERFGPNLESLSLEVVFVDQDIIRILIRDAKKLQWFPNDFNYTSRYSSNNYEFLLEQYPFSLEVRRKSDGVSIFNTAGLGFYFAERYLELETSANSSRTIFGLGERKGDLILNQGNYELWTTESKPGHHPFYLEITGKKSHGVFFHNFNAMEVTNGKDFIKFRTAGGVIDLFVILGDSAEQVVRNYHKIIGFPELPAFGTLGYYLGVTEFENTGDVTDVISTYEAKHIPYDGVVLGSKYLRVDLSFSLNENCGDMNNVSDYLQSTGKILVVEVPSAITSNSEAYGVSQEALLQIIATSGMGPAGYFDWSHPLAVRYWGETLQNFSKILRYDGVFLTENEVSTMDFPEQPSILLPFTPCNNSLDEGGLPVSAQHYNTYMEIDQHSLWGHNQATLTSAYLQDQSQKRSMVFSASTRAGTKALHLSRDSYSAWESMRNSVQNVISYGIFGIHNGADICRDGGSTNAELCTNWHRVAVFFPVMACYSPLSSKVLSLYSSKNIASIKKYIELRYSLGLYMYGLMFEANLHGGTVVRPMFFEFPDVPLRNYPEQVMLGSALLGVFASYDKSSTITVYLPSGKWYNIRTDQEVLGQGSTFFENNQESMVFLRSGAVIPVQNSSDAKSISEMRGRGIEMLVALDEKYQAQGVIYVDDGVSINTIRNKGFSKVVCTAGISDQLVVKFNSLVNGFTQDFAVISLIKVYGCRKPLAVKIQHVDVLYKYENSVLRIFTNITTYSITEIRIFL